MARTLTTTDNSRTAEWDEERNTLTVFEGLSIIATLDVAEDITPGEIWVLIYAAESAPQADYTAPYFAEREAQRAQAAEDTTGMADWFIALLNQNRACADNAAFESVAYKGYIAYGLSMTDGYFAPLDFESWLTGFRKAPVTELYYGNDNRNVLAPIAVSYGRSRVTVLPATPAWDTLAPKAADRTRSGDRNAPRGSRHNR